MPRVGATTGRGCPFPVVGVFHVDIDSSRESVHRQPFSARYLSTIVGAGIGLEEFNKFVVGNAFNEMQSRFSSFEPLNAIRL